MSALVAYWGVHEFGFVFDDQGIAGSTALRAGDWLDMAFGQYQSLSNRPLTCLTLVIDHAISGGVDAGSMHVTNLLLHLANSVLVAVLLRQLLGCAWLPAALGASVWAVHPLTVDAVAYVTQRSMLLMGLFTVLAGIALLRSARATRPGRWWLLCILATALAMASKEECAALPILLLLGSRAFLATSWQQVGRRWPLFAGLAATWSVLLACVLWGPRNPTVGYETVPPATAWEWLLTQAQSVSHYARSVVLPTGLRGIYDFAVIRETGPVALRGGMILAAIGASAWLWFRNQRLAFAGAWFFLLLAPTSSIYPIITEPCADRRMYLPLLAFLAPLTALGAARLRPPVLGAIAGLLITLLIWQTRSLASTYRDQDLFDAHAVATNDLDNEGFMAGKILATAARLEVKRGNLARAQELTQRSMRCVAPGPEELVANAALLEQLGDPATAEQQLRALLKDYPDFAKALSNLARLQLAKATQASPQAAGQLLGEARALFVRALELQPLAAEIQNSYGVFLHTVGQTKEAVLHLRRAIELEPRFTEARRNLGIAYHALDDPRAALKLWDELLREDPNDPIRADADATRAMLRSGRRKPR
ncbi:MAG: tetratricopeptide repeat protein [bacterium]|nr:tetratricopeptide repeat protein [bacterium]